MTRKANIQHGQARRHPMSHVWPVLGGVLLAVAVSAPLVIQIFGDA